MNLLKTNGKHIKSRRKANGDKNNTGLLIVYKACQKIAEQYL